MKSVAKKESAGSHVACDSGIAASRHVSEVRTSSCARNHSLDLAERQLRQIAFDLHDGPLQALSAAAAMLVGAERTADIESARAQAAAASGFLDCAFLELRSIVGELRPQALDADGVIAKLKDYVEEFEAHWGLPVVLSSLGNPRSLNDAMQVLIFRVVQESLSNARKHAEPSRVEVEVAFGDSCINISIHDDGVGFDEQAVDGRWSRERRGLLGMRERVSLAGGSLCITSARHDGTRVTACIPVEY